jgi:hypothetical protein
MTKPGMYNPSFFNKLAQEQGETPLLDTVQIERFCLLQAVFEKELKYKAHESNLKVYSAYKIYKPHAALLKNPLRVEAKKISYGPALKCILTGDLIEQAQTCVAFFMKTSRTSMLLRAVIKDEKHIPLLLKFGSFVKAKAHLAPKKPKLLKAEKAAQEKRAHDLQLASDKKYCNCCGKVLNPECKNLKELAKKRRCNDCIEKNKKPGEFKHCRTCGQLFKPKSHLDVFCEKDEIKEKPGTD